MGVSRGINGCEELKYRQFFEKLFCEGRVRTLAKVELPICGEGLF